MSGANMSQIVFLKPRKYHHMPESTAPGFTAAAGMPLKGRQQQLLQTQRAWRDMSMLRGKNCHKTSFAAQLLHIYPHHGGNFEKGHKALSCGGGEAICKAF